MFCLSVICFINLEDICAFVINYYDIFKLTINHICRYYSIISSSV